jgi:DNA topoisomerase I
MTRAQSPIRILRVAPVDSARTAGLRYVDDNRPGVRRTRKGCGFSYTAPDGRPIHPSELERIRALAIPPAWSDVWICPDPRGHIQATGRDARGRKQYRYHPRWREVRDEVKYGRMIAFGAALPQIRRRVERDIALPGMPKEKVIATVVQLLDQTLIRIGNEEYARSNESYGLTTLREDHVKVQGNRVHFHFRGKSGKEHAIDLTNPRLARILKRCQELPGQELFHFRDGKGALRPIESTDVNAYLRRAANADFTAKDFRTWHGTLLAAQALSELGAKGRPTKRGVALAVERVATRLGNTPSVCRKNYVHPAVVSRYLRGELTDTASFIGGRAESTMLTMLMAESKWNETPLVAKLKATLRAIEKGSRVSSRRAA